MMNKQQTIDAATAILSDVHTLTNFIYELESQLNEAPYVVVNEGGERGYKYRADENARDEMESYIEERKLLVQRFESDEFGEDNLAVDAFEWIFNNKEIDDVVYKYA